MIRNSEQVIRSLYRVLLHREPEPGAVEHWQAQVANGLDLDRLIAAFLESEEHRSFSSKPTALRFPPGHFYSPIVDVSEVHERFWRRASQPTPASLPGIAISLSSQTQIWQQMLPFLWKIPFGPEKSTKFRYHFENPSYSYGDGSVLYSMLRLFSPQRVIEIGSGYSSACTMDTIDHYLDGRVAVTFIEPYPSLLRQTLGNDTLGRSTLHESAVQDVPLTVFDGLKNGDILFIDSTHVIKTESDVCQELFDILPRLAPGVLIHFHDVFWPFEYPTSWVLEENRSWNELYGLRAFLMNNNQFEIIFFNDYFARFKRDLIQATYPMFLKNTGGSLWLRKLPQGEIPPRQST
jgi:predicted O-methyltransferase YrrM